MKHMLQTTLGIALLWFATTCQASASTTNLFDDFPGTSLDTNLWSATNPSAVTVGSSKLNICAGCVGSPVNVTSLSTFLPTPVSASEEFTLEVKVTNTRITWAGFNGGGDTLAFRRDQGTTWFVSEGVNLFDTGVLAANDSSSNLRIIWGTNSVSFQIDSNLDSTYEYGTNITRTSSIAMPVFLRDQATISLSQYDSVLVTSVPEPGTVSLAAFALVLGVVSRHRNR